MLFSSAGKSTRQASCVVGLGNPGERYRKTRHNVGFMVVDELARRRRVRMRRRFWFRADSGRSREQPELLLVKPRTFMNRSGLVARRLTAWGGCGADRLLVVVDDLALPLGTLRLRSRGSAGSHNGLRSIIGALGTDRFGRLRVGIGACPTGTEVVDYVLSEFDEAERPRVERMIGRAADAVEYAAEHGFEKAMNEVNTRQEVED